METKGAIRLISVENGEHQLAIESLLSDFNAAHPGPPVRMESVAGGGFALLADKVRTGFASGNPPDMFQMWPGEIVGPFVDATRLRPLDDFYRRGRWEDFLIPWAVDATTRHGHKWGVPTCSHGMSFWYRKDIFNRYGLKEPETYADLEHICSTLAGHEIYCLSLGGKYGWLTMRLLDFFLEKTCGPALHDKINRLEESWDRPEVVEAYRLLRRWVDMKWLAPGFLSVPPDDARLPFYRGDAAMVFEGDWLEDHMVREDEQDIANYDFFLPPTDRTPRRMSAFAEFFVVSKDNPRAERLYQFFDWVLKPEQQARTLRGISWTARKGIAVDAAAQPRMVKWRALLDTVEAFRPTDQQFPKEVMDNWWAVQDRVIAGQVTPEAAAPEVQAIMAAYKRKRDATRPSVLDWLAQQPGDKP